MLCATRRRNGSNLTWESGFSITILIYPLQQLYFHKKIAETIQLHPKIFGFGYSIGCGYPKLYPHPKPNIFRFWYPKKYPIPTNFGYSYPILYPIPKNFGCNCACVWIILYIIYTIVHPKVLNIGYRIGYEYPQFLGIGYFFGYLNLKMLGFGCG